MLVYQRLQYKLNTQQDFVIVNVGKLLVVYLLLTDSRKRNRIVRF